MEIKAVTFDVGGTLIEPWPSVGHVYAEVAARHGLNSFSAAQLNDRFKKAWRMRGSFGYSRSEWEALVNEVFDREPTNSSGTFFCELYDRFAGADAWHLFEDVVPALDRLASLGMKSAVISNWDDRLRGLLGSLKLNRYFEAFAISCEVGFAKPSPVIFEHAAAKLGLPPSSVLHIGDSLEMDVEGAKAAGYRALQICRRAGAGEGDIHSLAELPAKIEKLEAKD